MFTLALPQFALADCEGGAAIGSEAEFYRWCRSCGGTPAGSGIGLRCIPGGGGGRAGADDGAAAAARQRRLKEVRREQGRRRREDEDKKRREEAFERSKSDGLRTLKGFTSSPTGLKGASSGGFGRLKDVDSPPDKPGRCGSPVLPYSGPVAPDPCAKAGYPLTCPSGSFYICCDKGNVYGFSATGGSGEAAGCCFETALECDESPERRGHQCYGCRRNQ